jgi:hypothetical protein
MTNYYGCDGKTKVLHHLFKVRVYKGGPTILFDAKLMPDAVRKKVVQTKSMGRCVHEFGFKEVVDQVLSLRWSKFVNDRGQTVRPDEIGKQLRLVQQHNIPLNFIRSGVNLCDPLDGDAQSPLITAADGVLLLDSPKWC